jgi:hypothetical protein
MSPTTVNVGALRALVRQLQDCGVRVPGQVVNAAALLEAATSGELTRLALQAPALDLLATDQDSLVEQVLAHARRRLILDTVADSVWHVTLDLADQAGAVLADQTDNLIDQMRPAFNAAAALFTKATKAGIAAGMTAEQVIALGDSRALTAWRALPDAAAVLDSIAAARLALSDTLGVAPHAAPFGPRPYGAAFSTQVPPWDRNAMGVHRWLTLAGYGLDVTLLSIADTEAAVQETAQSPRRPTAPSNPEAPPTYTPMAHAHVDA